MKPGADTIKKVAAVVVILSLIITVVVYAKHEVATGERRDALTEARYGYKVEQRYFVSRVYVSIWNTDGVSLDYVLNSCVLDKIIEQRWLAQDRAVLLNLQVKSSDSAPTVSPVRIVYDFQKGAIYINSPLTFGRVWNRANPVDKNWLSDEEFQAVLSGLAN